MIKSTHRKDFFISYNHHDSNWAEWIAWELEDSGYTTEIQAWDFGVGLNFVIEMDMGLRGAERLIAVLSPSYLESSFTASEWAVPFSNDPKGKDRRLVPVRVQEVDLDGLLGQIVYIDLVGKDEEAARAELMSKLSGLRGKPTQKPKFPAGERVVFPGIGSISPSRKYVKFELVLSGTIEEANRSRVEAIISHLQKLLNDSDLTLQEVRSGSIVITLQCSQAGFNRLKLLHSTGHLDQLIGFVVEGIRLVDRDPSEKVLARQNEVLRLLGSGMSLEEIAKTLDLKPSTVAFDKYRIMDMLGLKTEAGLLRYLLKCLGDATSSPDRDSSKKVSTVQSKVLELLAEGKSMKEVAQILNLKRGTVASDKHRNIDKLGNMTTEEVVECLLKRLGESA